MINTKDTVVEVEKMEKWTLETWRKAHGSLKMEYHALLEAVREVRDELIDTYDPVGASEALTRILDEQEADLANLSWPAMGENGGEGIDCIMTIDASAPDEDET